MKFKIVQYYDPHNYGNFLDASRGTNHVISEDDINKIWAGTHADIFEVEGAHPIVLNGVKGAVFCIDAFEAEKVQIEFDDGRLVTLRRVRNGANFWEAFVPEISAGQKYRYQLDIKGQTVTKSDPVGFGVSGETYETRFSIVTKLPLTDTDADKEWDEKRKQLNSESVPINVYELHVGSYTTREGDDPFTFGKMKAKHHSFDIIESGKPLTFKELAQHAIQEAKDMGYTHIEVMPPFGHINYKSWGYQVTEYFSIEGRYGTIQDFKDFIDACHEAGLGVILDWVPSHHDDRFCGLDGLGYGNEKSKWGTNIFDYKRNETRSLLLSNINFWLKLGIDGIRMDAVSEIIYVNPEKKEGLREDGIAFLGQVNDFVHQNHPWVITIAEDCSGYPHTTEPTSNPGGAGFDYQWAMWWMYAHVKEIFNSDDKSNLVANNRIPDTNQGNLGRKVIAISHDEHSPYDLKHHHNGSIYNGMGIHSGTGPDVHLLCLQRRAMLYAAQMLYPGKKLAFIGNIAKEPWNAWIPILRGALANDNDFCEIKNYIRALNNLYLTEPALHMHDTRPQLGYEPVVFDGTNVVNAYLRKSSELRKGIEELRDTILVVSAIGRNRKAELMFKQGKPIADGYQIGVSLPGWWQVIFNSFDYFSMYNHIPRKHKIAGADTGNNGGFHNRQYSIKLPLYAGSTMALKWMGG
ncbi:MAG: alpha-amylase family glycosyl hydrolase [Candidatus Margulisiibacteriota bacterium]